MNVDWSVSPGLAIAAVVVVVIFAAIKGYEWKQSQENAPKAELNPVLLTPVGTPGTEIAPLAKASFILGIVNIFMNWVIILPIIGLVMSCIALGNQKSHHDKQWMPWVALALNLVFLIVGIRAWMK